MCGCTLLLGSPHKNSDLRQCSTRQTTVYSYTTSHRSPCIRVDSPTQFVLHQHHDHYHPDSQFNNIIVTPSLSVNSNHHYCSSTLFKIFCLIRWFNKNFNFHLSCWM